MTLYLKYRPQTVSELDLTSVRERLSALLSKKEIPHAFLFAGPRGTGKTSSARILAKAINCEHKKENSFEPCNECETCLSITAGRHIDVIEMDAASNRGIDEIRSLKQDVMLAPVQATKKIYIIDEVHMLTSEAANAFLKTLEEPPHHAIFILATTDPQKLPSTVISRLSLIPFEKATTEEISQKLSIISQREGFEVEEGVFEKISKKADGSFRDAVKLLEELSLVNKKITNELFDASVSFTGATSMALLKLIKEGEISDQITYLQKLIKEGVDEKAFILDLINSLHSELLVHVGVSSADTIFTQEECILLLELLLDAKAKNFSSNFLLLEICLVKFSQRKDQPKKKELTLPQEKIEVTKTEVITKEKETSPIKADSNNNPSHNFSGEPLDDTVWAKILFDLRAKNASVEALLRASKPLDFDGVTFTVGVFFKFHKERLETSSYQLIFESVLKDHFGQNIKSCFVLTDPPARPQTVQNVVPPQSSPVPSLTQTSSPDIINAAKEIFGS